MADTIESLVIDIKYNAPSAAAEIRKTTGAVKSLSNETKKAKSPLENFVASLKRIAFYRVLRTIIKNIGQAFKEGLQYAYAFSQGINTEGHRFAEAMDSMKSATTQMKAQLGSAFIGLLAAIAPVVIQIVNLVTKLADALAQFFAAFTGKTYLKATKVADKFADTMKAGGAAAKEWKNQLLGFDEINRLNEPNQGGGGGGSAGLDPSSMFEDTDINPKIKRFVDLIKGYVGEIWDKIKWAYDRISAYIEEHKPVFDDLKRHIWGVLTGIKIILEGFIEFVVGVLTGDWKTAWEGAGQMLQGFGIVVNNTLGIVTETLDGFFQFATSGLADMVKKWDDKLGANGWIIQFASGIINVINLVRFTIEDAIDKLGLVIEGFTSLVSHVIHGDFEAAMNDLAAITVVTSVNTQDHIREMARNATNELFGFETRLSTAGNGSADMAETIASNMQAIRDQIAATAQTSIQGENTGDGIFFKAQIGQAWSKIKRAFGHSSGSFANGGFPDAGQLFIANESNAGAELVGNIGGRTAVASNADILGGIREGVYEAVTAANGGNNNVAVKVYLDSREIKAGQQRLNRAWGVG